MGSAFTHTPKEVSLWDDFDNLVRAEGMKPINQKLCSIDLVAELNRVRLPRVIEEEHVTDRLERLLEVFSDESWDLSGGFVFPKKNQPIIAFPDIIAEVRDSQVYGDGDISDYTSPPRVKKARLRRENTALIKNLYRLPFETKPIWKYMFLDSQEGHQTIIDLWEVPEDFDANKMRSKDPLPQY